MPAAEMDLQRLTNFLTASFRNGDVADSHDASGVPLTMCNVSRKGES